jgi:hypothetical protein
LICGEWCGGSREAFSFRRYAGAIGRSRSAPSFTPTLLLVRYLTVFRTAAFPDPANTFVYRPRMLPTFTCDFGIAGVGNRRKSDVSETGEPISDELVNYPLRSMRDYRPSNRFRNLEFVFIFMNSVVVQGCCQSGIINST